MYVDKAIPGIKEVLTLSRLNRARPQKHDTQGQETLMITLPSTARTAPAAMVSCACIVLWLA